MREIAKNASQRQNALHKKYICVAIFKKQIYTENIPFFTNGLQMRKKQESVPPKRRANCLQIPTSTQPSSFATQLFKKKIISRLLLLKTAL